MNLHKLLLARDAIGKPLRVGLIGAGKFGSMFLAQARRTRGLHVLGVADLDPARARAALANVGWPAEQINARLLSEAAERGTTWVGDGCEGADRASGAGRGDRSDRPAPRPASPMRRHAIPRGQAHRHGQCGSRCAGRPAAGEAKAREAAGVVYSLAYGDQPALICELVDWARSCGFPVIAAGKGTEYRPENQHASTPETVWGFYGLTPEQARRSAG